MFESQKAKNVYWSNWRKKHPYIDARQRERYRQRRAAVVLSLGNQCQICGVTAVRFQLHHLTYRNGDPYKQRGKSGAYRAIIREAEKDPTNFKLLCYRCHSTVTFLTSGGRLSKFLDCVRPMMDFVETHVFTPGHWKEVKYEWPEW